MQGGIVDFSAQLDVLQQHVAGARSAVDAAASESRQQLRQRIDQAQLDVDLAVKDAQQRAGDAAASARSKWAQMKADAAARMDKRAAHLDDPGLQVVHPGGGVGLHLRPLAACAGGGVSGPLLCVLDGQVDVKLGLVDPLPELLAGLAGGGIHRRPRLRHVLLQGVELCGEVHDSSLHRVDCRRRPPLPCSPTLGRRCGPVIGRASRRSHPVWSSAHMRQNDLAIPGHGTAPEQAAYDPSVDRSSPTVAHSAAEVAGALAPRIAELSAEIYDLIVRDIPQLRADRRVLTLLEASVGENVATVLHVQQHGIDMDHVHAPAAAEEYARRLAQRGVPIAALLRAYRIGSARFQDWCLQELGRRTDNASVVSAAGLRIAEITALYIDQVSEEVVSAYEAEKENWLRNLSAARAARVRALLRG